MALTDDFTYKLGDDGVILNPNSTMFPFVDINKITGLDNAPYRMTEREHEGNDGGFMDAEFEKGRSIILEGTVYGENDQVETYLDSLKYNYAPSRTLIPFFFKKPGVSERFLQVKPLGCKYDVEQVRRIGRTDIQITMFAEDPRIYSADIRNIAIPQDAIVITGRGYNKSYNYSYGAPIAPSQENLYVSGNRSTPVIFSITGHAEFPTIINETIGTTMAFDLTIPLGSTLVIDTYYHTVRLDEANRRASMTTPSWFFLQPGDNYIRYRSSTSGGTSVLTALYYDAWR